jgi:hypothetical protein
MTESCDAGRRLVPISGHANAKSADPFWTEPCPNVGTDVLFVNGEKPGTLLLCRAHLLAIKPEAHAPASRPE